EDSSLATVEVSDSSSLIGDFEFLDSTSGTNDNSSPDLDLLSQEINTKGPLQSDLELR
ncbi:hypothetical protein ACJMK2_041277, partial [Sinanodonta woodiana]